MKNYLLGITASSLALLTIGCGGSGPQGQLIGESNRVEYSNTAPMGMVWVPSGVMKAGAGDEDIANAMDANVRTFNMVGFYMDATEITNAEYRQFTNWVRDSIAHTLMNNVTINNAGNTVINWDSRRPDYNDEQVQMQLVGSLMLAPNQTIDGRSKVDASKLVYAYSEYNYAAAAQNPNLPPTNFMVDKSINAYPDTNVWMRMFSYSMNEPIAQQYNWFPSFDEYPVVGVNWKQANAFCHWRTMFYKSYRERNGRYSEGRFRLPTELEWEWAARGGRELSPYPWGGPYVMNKKGCYLANFKPMPGDYSADGGLYTVRANAYTPNDYGLYNMSGNVAEWTADNYNISAYSNAQYSDLNGATVNEYQVSESDPEWMKRKVVKGGSWRDTKYYLNISVRDTEFMDTAKAYIGFRTVYNVIAQHVINDPKAR